MLDLGFQRVELASLRIVHVAVARLASFEQLLHASRLRGALFAQLRDRLHFLALSASGNRCAGTRRQLLGARSAGRYCRRRDLSAERGHDRIVSGFDTGDTGILIRGNRHRAQLEPLPQLETQPGGALDRLRRFQRLEADGKPAHQASLDHLPCLRQPRLQLARLRHGRHLALDLDALRGSLRGSDPADRVGRVVLPQQRQRQLELRAGRLHDVAHAIGRRR